METVITKVDDYTIHVVTESGEADLSIDFLTEQRGKIEGQKLEQNEARLSEMAAIESKRVADNSQRDVEIADVVFYLSEIERLSQPVVEPEVI